MNSKNLFHIKNLIKRLQQFYPKRDTYDMFKKGDLNYSEKYRSRET